QGTRMIEPKVAVNYPAFRDGRQSACPLCRLSRVANKRQSYGRKVRAPRVTRQRIAHGEGHMLQGFKQFMLRGNVLDLAVAVVMGAAFGAVVAALVKDLITPLIAAIVGK